MGQPKYHVQNIPAIEIALKKSGETPRRRKTQTKDLSACNARQDKTLRPNQAKTERVQLNRAEYWSKVKDIDFKDLVFLDEMGVLLGLMRTHAHAAPGERAYDFKTFLSRWQGECDWRDLSL